MVKKISGLAVKTRHILDPIRLVRMVKEIIGYGASRRISFTIQASWMGSLQAFSRDFSSSPISFTICTRQMGSKKRNIKTNASGFYRRLGNTLLGHYRILIQHTACRAVRQTPGGWWPNRELLA
jgi:hypothetical protein